jgi:hypothetical protein
MKVIKTEGTKTSVEKIKLPYTLIDVHEIKADDIEH